MENSSIKENIEDTQKAAAEIELQKYGIFFQKFSNNLDEFQKIMPYTWTFSNKNRINVSFEPEEQISSLQELISSENKIIDKVLTVFCTLCNEVSFLDYELKSKYLDAIQYYGEATIEPSSYEDCQLQMSKFLYMLQCLSNFVKYCERVIFEILSQLSAFYALHFEITDANLFKVFDALADALLIFVILDEALSNNNTLIYHWSLYRRTILLAQHNSCNISCDSHKLYQLKKLISRLEIQLLSKKIFENFLNTNFEKKIPIKKNKNLEEEFASYIKTLSNDLEKTMNKENCTNMTKLTKLCTSFVLYVNLFSTYDKKFLKNISEISKKCPLVTLRYNVLIQLNSFILHHIGSLLKQSEKKLFERDQQYDSNLCLTDITQKLNKNVAYYTSQILSWMLELETILESRTNSVQLNYLENICSTLLKGIEQSMQIKALLTAVSNLHIFANKPMYKNSAISFCRLTELIKCVQSTYIRHHSSIFKLMNYLVQYIQYQCVIKFNAIKKCINTKDKHLNDIRIDTMSSLVIAEHCLSGSPTITRLTIAAICINLITQAKCFKDFNNEKLNEFLKTLITLSLLHQKLFEVTECTFIYWNKSTLPLYLEYIEKNKLSVNRIQYILSALENVSLHFNKIFNQPNKLAYNDIINILITHMIQPINRKMEENLRLHTLSHLQTEKRTLQQSDNELNNFQRIDIFSFNEKRLDIKFQVESYLDKTFYDLTTVALHDWQIYGEMRTLAKYKFQLHVTDDGLPNHTLEQGPDLLEITRNVHTFVANHYYNLNHQIFIEASSNNKHVNVINIKHTTNSIRTHGAGIMNTAVNYTYQFLCLKLQIFSQFLYDEQIKSRLLRDISYLNEQQTNIKFPFDRAERFLKSIIKLGVNGDGTTCLDQFRILISHIGNALGYVRLIKSGGLRYFSNAIAFVPNLERIVDFKNISSVEGYSEHCQLAATNLNNVIKNMGLNISEGTNYFKLLVDVFSSVIEDPKNDHLKNFYAVVPALTINFVEYMITAKEGLLKKNNKTKITFTDDGFAMGTAYLLHTLNQRKKFDSLQWFHSVNERNETIKKNILQQVANIPKEDLKLNHTLNLSLKRLEIFQQEFNQLFYNIYSAQILFQGNN